MDVLDSGGPTPEQIGVMAVKSPERTSMRTLPCDRSHLPASNQAFPSERRESGGLVAQSGGMERWGISP